MWTATPWSAASGVQGSLLLGSAVGQRGLSKQCMPAACCLSMLPAGRQERTSPAQPQRTACSNSSPTAPYFPARPVQHGAGAPAVPGRGGAPRQGRHVLRRRAAGRDLLTG